MDKLIEMTLCEFTQCLGSDSPAPGGGSTAALCAAMGTALTTMVARLTMGREKYRDSWDVMEHIIDRGDELCGQLTCIVDRDTEAFNQVSAVFSMPKGTDEEKSLRREAMQSALKNATLVPFEMMRLCIEAIELMSSGLGKVNTSALSDFGVAALCLKTALMGGWLNVKINLSSIKDEEFVEFHTAEGKLMLDSGVKTVDQIYEWVQDSI